MMRFTQQSYQPDKLSYKEMAFDGSAQYNLFQVTGIVYVSLIYAHVETATPANKTAASLQLFPAGGAAIQITSLAGSDISDLPAGSLIVKDNVVANAITVDDSTLGYISEQLGFLFSPFFAGQKVAIDTYIRLNITEAGPDGGLIHWHAIWTPLSDAGLLVPV